MPARLRDPRVPGAPGMLRRHARGRVPILELRGLVDRDPRPDQVARSARQPGPPGRAQQGLNPVRVLVPGCLRQLPALRLHPRRQLPDVIQCGPRAAALRHHPSQHRPDLRICPSPRRRQHPLSRPVWPCRHCLWPRIRQHGTAAPNFTGVTQPYHSTSHSALRSRQVRRILTATSKSLNVKPRLSYLAHPYPF